MTTTLNSSTARRRRINHSRRGAALIELGIILSLLLILMLGCVDFGRFAYTYIAVTNAAREGSYVGSSNSYTAATQSQWEQNVRDAVTGELENFGNFDPADMHFPTPVATIDTDGQRRVRVEAGYPFNVVVPWPGLSGDLLIIRAVEMRSIR